MKSELIDIISNSIEVKKKLLHDVSMLEKIEQAISIITNAF